MQGIENEEKKKEPEKMGMPERLAFILVKNHPFTPLSLFPNTNQKRIQVSTKKIKFRHVREVRLQNERMHVGFGACSMRVFVCRLSRVAFSRCWFLCVFGSLW